MKLPGFCTGCNRPKLVNVTGYPGPGVPSGLCDDCQDAQDSRRSR